MRYRPEAPPNGIFVLISSVSSLQSWLNAWLSVFVRGGEKVPVTLW